jgi:phosphotransferase system enzyme I (PtsI)
MAGRPVVIRTLDLGADKLGLSPRAEHERNPFLGLRSIRLSLRNLSVFRTQLRAVLRASVAGPLKVMFPLISTLSELRQARTVLMDIMEDLDEEGVAFDRQLPVGMMVEVPAAALQIDRFAREADFLSIGTNDLIQYALAVDRSNRDVAALYDGGDPAILKLIDQVVRAGIDHETPVSLCGQMCASPVFTMVLLGLGLRSLSLPPIAIPEIKNVCRRVSLAACQTVARRALRLETALEVNDYLKQELARAMSASAAQAG